MIHQMEALNGQKFDQARARMRSKDGLSLCAHGLRLWCVSGIPECSTEVRRQLCRCQLIALIKVPLHGSLEGVGRRLIFAASEVRYASSSQRHRAAWILG